MPVQGVPGVAVGEAEVGAAGQTVQQGGGVRCAGAAGVDAVVQAAVDVEVRVQVRPDVPLLLGRQVELLAGRGRVDHQDVDVLRQLVRERAERDELVDHFRVRAREQSDGVHLRDPAAVGEVDGENRALGGARLDVGHRHRAVQAGDGYRPQVGVRVVGLAQFVQVLFEVGRRLPGSALFGGVDAGEDVVVVLVLGCGGGCAVHAGVSVVGGARARARGLAVDLEPYRMATAPPAPGPAALSGR